MSSNKRKHITLSLAEKLALLERLDKGESVQKVAREVGVGVTTVKDWRKNRKSLESHTMTIDSSEKGLKMRKTLKKPASEILDNAYLWIWFEQERRKGTPLSGPIIKEKALLLYKKTGRGT
uniref:HTH psq-type domain-containing protein n=1 Tax=Graphocephala atropunctata TaxID=36148 RepID=A0A1B6LKS3_9HEMI